MMMKIQSKIAALIIVFSLFPIQAGAQAGNLAGNPPDLNVCRFGITSPSSSAGYPLDALGVGGYLDWRTSSNPGLPPGVEYLPVLSVSDRAYGSVLSSLGDLLAAHPGATWIVGNEPDTTYNGQDNVTAETYAERFYAIASQIRSADPSARIAFGTIVQPTPLRLRYLRRAWDRLIQPDLAGSAGKASGLIDAWSIHAFMLNEQPGQWGTGVPQGFENDHPDAFVTNDLSTTYSISLFKSRVAAFRAWMRDLGEGAKPLWITEYGSLIPNSYVDWAGNTVVSDATTANFMAATFDYLLTATDASTGMPGDGRRLVQRWFWYSLNDSRDHFGGTLFDPHNNRAITPVGVRFRDYIPPAGISTDIKPLAGHTVVPVQVAPDGSHVDYAVLVRVGSSLFANAPTRARISLYENNALVAGPVDTLMIQRCGGLQVTAMWWRNVLPGSPHNLEIRVDALDRTDADLSNNTGALVLNGSELGLPRDHLFLPFVDR
jgi:hypothetical protein